MDTDVLDLEIVTYFMLLFNILCYFFIIDLVSMHI